MKQYINLLKSLYLNIPSPISVSVNLTNKCNQHCVYCEVGQGLVKTEKPLLVPDDLKWIIDEMNRSNIPTLSLGGKLGWVVVPIDFMDISGLLEPLKRGIRHRLTLINADLKNNHLNRGAEA